MRKDERAGKRASIGGEGNVGEGKGQTNRELVTAGAYKRASFSKEKKEKTYHEGF